MIIPPPPSLLSVDTTPPPGDAYTAEDLARGVPGYPAGVVPLIPAFCWLRVAPEAALLCSSYSIATGYLSSTGFVSPGEAATPTGKSGSTPTSTSVFFNPEGQFYQAFLSLSFEASRVFVDVRLTVEPPIWEFKQDSKLAYGGIPNAVDSAWKRPTAASHSLQRGRSIYAP